MTPDARIRAHIQAAHPALTPGELDALVDIRQKLGVAYPDLAAAELDEMLAEAARNPLADWIAAATERLTQPQRIEIPGLEGDGFDEQGERVRTVQHPSDVEPAATASDRTGDLLVIAIQAIAEESHGRRALQTQTAACMVLFGKLPQQNFAAKFGLSPSALSRAIEHVRKILRKSELGRMGNSNAGS